MGNKLIFLLFLILSLTANSISFSECRVMKTPFFTVFYPECLQGQAETVLNSLTRYRLYVEGMTGHSRQRVSLVLEDAGMISNGFASPVFDRIIILSCPPGLGSLQSTENWFTGVAVHEYTHLLHMQNAGGIPGFLTDIFGYSFSPNSLCPSWMIEGIAVFNESNYSKYSGRLNDSYFKSFGQITASEDSFPDIVTATYWPVKYPSGTSYYLYGALFFDYLAVTYGNERFSEFFTLYGRSLLSYCSPILPSAGIDRTSRNIFGKTLPVLWDELKEYYRNKESNHAGGANRMTQHGWTILNLVLNNDRLYYERSFQVKTAPFHAFYFSRIVEHSLITGDSSTLTSTSSSYGHPVKFHGDSIYFLESEMKRGFNNFSYLGFGLTRLLFEYNRAENKKTLLQTGRIRAFDLLFSGEILYSMDRQDGFGSELYIMEEKSGINTLLIKTDLLIERIISDEKRIVVTARRDYENFGLYLYSREKNTFHELINSACVERDAYLSDGRLLFTSNLDGVQSCYMYDFKQGLFSRLKNHQYILYPVLYEDLVYFVSLNPEGNDIYFMEADFDPFNFPDNKKVLPRQDDIEYEGGSYLDNLKTLYPKIRLPYFWFDQAEGIAGVYMEGKDAAGHFEYIADIGYDFKENSWDNSLSLGTYLFSPLYIRAGYRDEDKGTYSALIQYPVLYGIRTGFSRLWAGIYWECYNNNARKEICPYLSLGFKYPSGFISTYHSSIIESRSLSSRNTRNGMINQAHAVQYVKNSQISLNFLSIIDKDFNGFYNYALRGYSEKLKANDFFAFQLDFTFPILKLRKGFWNPGIYFEDIFLTLFCDYAWTKDHPYTAGGMELHMETRAMFNMPFDIYIRASFNRDDEALFSLGIKSGNLPGIFRKLYSRAKVR